MNSKSDIDDVHQDSVHNSQDKKWPEKMKVSQAAKFLRITPSSMSNMINSGKIKYQKDPLDNRVKLVRRADLEKLLRMRTGV